MHAQNKACGGFGETDCVINFGCGNIVNRKGLDIFRNRQILWFFADNFRKINALFKIIE